MYSEGILILLEGLQITILHVRVLLTNFHEMLTVNFLFSTMHTV